MSHTKPLSLAAAIALAASLTGAPAIAQEESEQMPPEQGEELNLEQATFSELDTNGDGSISADEWTGTEAQFENVDADKNGVISEDELSEGKKTEELREKQENEQPY